MRNYTTYIYFVREHTGWRYKNSPFTVFTVEKTHPPLVSQCGTCRTCKTCRTCRTC